MSSTDPYVVSIGEALVDMLETWRGDERVYVPSPGGSPFNVATGLARLGTSCRFVTAFASDPLGRWLKGFLVSEGVDLSASQDTELPTSIAMTSFDGAEPHFVFYGSPPSYGDLDVEGLPDRLASDAAVVHAGSIGLLEPALYDVADRLFDVAGPVRTVDPNVRLSLVDDLDAYRARMEALFARADVVKLSSVDAAGLYPGRSEDAVIDHLTALGVPTVVMTLGERGLRWRHAGVDDHLPGPSIEASDTTGAGDSCMVAILRGLARTGHREDPERWRALMLEARSFASLICQRPGGAAAMPHPHELAAVGSPS
ncbi:MAG: carbohydrate kinase [Nitriliruptoraceae bacterium]|nr:carbohydrate kinase [Nitriliruptoraceae bacterium]